MRFGPPSKEKLYLVVSLIRSINMDPLHWCIAYDGCLRTLFSSTWSLIKPNRGKGVGTIQRHCVDLIMGASFNLMPGFSALATISDAIVDDPRCWILDHKQIRFTNCPFATCLCILMGNGRGWSSMIVHGRQWSQTIFNDHQWSLMIIMDR